MAVLLYGAGAVAFLGGAVMLGFGIPVHEFSFGNTLILAGIIAMVGGLIVAGLGVVVSHLHQLADALTRSAPARAGRSPLPIEAASRLPGTPARIPFPPRPKIEQNQDMGAREPSGFEPVADMPFNEPVSDHHAPGLPNPDEGPITVEDEISLSPRDPFAPAAKPAADESLPPPPFARRDEPQAFDVPWRAPPLPPMPKAPQPNAAQPAASPPPRQSAYFESMWPSEPKTGEPGFDERKKEKAEQPAAPKFQSPFAPPPRGQPKPEARPAADATPEEAAFAAPEEEPAPADEPRHVAILKSGVVDGMGYTLYVDGSIEAELPQGTLHFASINELRSHLEKTS